MDKWHFFARCFCVATLAFLQAFSAMIALGCCQSDLDALIEEIFSTAKKAPQKQVIVGLDVVVLIPLGGR